VLYGASGGGGGGKNGQRLGYLVAFRNEKGQGGNLTFGRPGCNRARWAKDSWGRRMYCAPKSTEPRRGRASRQRCSSRGIGTQSTKTTTGSGPNEGKGRTGEPGHGKYGGKGHENPEAEFGNRNIWLSGIVGRSVGAGKKGEA